MRITLAIPPDNLKTADSDLHVVGFEHIVDPANEANIHHFTHDGRHWLTAVNVVKAKLLLVHLSRTADGEFTVWMDW